jgi:putative addiction module component (TIGR02574 family)
MNTIEVSKLPLREKLQIMQSIWEDLAGHVDRLEVPQSHKDLLDERRRRVETGESKILDWEEVKHTIGGR